MRRNNLAVAGRLIVLIKPLLLVMFVAILAGVAGFLCAIFIPVFGGYALLSVLGETTPLSLGFIFVAVLLFAVLRGVLRYAEQASNHYIAFKVLALIRDKVFRALRRLAPAKLETKDKGNLVSVITTDIELLEVFYAHTISPIIIALLTSSFIVVFLWHFHWLLAIIALTGYIVVGGIIPVVASKIGRKVGEEYRKDFGGLSSYILDSLRGLQEVLQYNMGESRLKEIQNKTDILTQKQKELKNIEGVISALNGAAIVLFSVLVLFASVVLQQEGVLRFSGVLIATICVFSSFGPVVALANLSNNLLHTFASAGRVLDILDEVPITPEIEGEQEVAFIGMHCEKINFSYEREDIFTDFNLQIPVGKTLGIGGKSGSGKSTLLRLLMRFWDVNSGKVSVGDTDVKKINTANLRNMQGFVTQETQMFHDSIENNVKIANLSATHQQVENACRKAAIHHFIESLPQGYNTDVGELGESLSGGEKQRIGLARAFLHDAPMILLDEPTSNLDSLNEGLVLQALAEESKRKTVVLVSHRASTLSIADEILRIESKRHS